MLEQLNNFINGLLGKLGKQTRYEEIGDNLIADATAQSESSKDENLPKPITIPATDIAAIAYDTEKITAHEKFVKTNPQPIDQVQPIPTPPISAHIPQSSPAVPLPQIGQSQHHFLRGLAYFVAALCLLGIAFLVFNMTQLYTGTSITPVQNSSVLDNPVVRSDTTRTISVETTLSQEVVRSNIFEALHKEKVDTGKLAIVVPSYLRESVQNNQKVLVSEIVRGDEFMFIFAPSAPLALRTVFSGDYAVGIANVTGKSEGFMALSVNDKVVGLRELLNYEPFMLNDFKDMLSLRTPNADATWKSVTVHNYDMRILSDLDGVVLVYGFATPKTVIFAPNVDVFEKVAQRLK